MRVVGLFSGIGGIEHGLARAGHHADLLCEIDSGAQRILAREFPDTQLVADVREIRSIPSTDLLAAGFPCQDLSQAGNKNGITGKNSGLVGEVFRLLSPKPNRPPWLLLENVPFMLHLDGGRAMNYLTTSLESLGYTWAYRVVDARAFGVPQRRQRVVLLASLSDDPRSILFASSHDEPAEVNQRAEPKARSAYGFYWTEGSRGIGWAQDAVPTVKGGSKIGIPSPPAVWIPNRQFVGTIHISDAERLQGFRAGYTAEAVAGQDGSPGKVGARWTLVGNAVCVPMAEWVGDLLTTGTKLGHSPYSPLKSPRWPKAAWGHQGKRFSADVTMWPCKSENSRLMKFLEQPLAPLSAKATSGFMQRALTGRLRYTDEFISSLEIHLLNMRNGAAA